MDLFAVTESRKCNEFVSRFKTFNDPLDLEDQLETILKSESSGTLMAYRH